MSRVVDSWICIFFFNQMIYLEEKKNCNIIGNQKEKNVFTYLT